MLTGLGLVTLINFGYNIAVARFLGPTAFGHTTAVYTLLILISSVTLSFQILTAKMVAQQASPQAQTTVYKAFHWRGWIAGVIVALLLLVFRHAVTDYLNLPDTLLIELLAIGTAFYVPLGARRGYIQGVCRFRHLASNLVLEGVVRFVGSLALIVAGAALTLGIAATVVWWASGGPEAASAPSAAAPAATDSVPSVAPIVAPAPPPASITPAVPKAAPAVVAAPRPAAPVHKDKPKPARGKSKPPAHP